MADFKSGENPFASADIPQGVNPFDVQGNGNSQPAVAAIPENSLWDETKRQVGLSARAAANVVASPLTLGGNVLGKAVNAIAGKQVFQPSTETFDQMLTSAGLPEAKRPIEQYTQSLARTAPGLAIPSNWPAMIAGNAAIGAADAPQGQELSGALWGAGGGALGQGLSRAVGGIVRPTAEAQVLLDRGVPLTPGQAAGKDSFAKKAEEWVGTLPIASHYVRAAQNRAVTDANVAAAQAVANVVDKQVKLGAPPREAIEQTREIIGKTYTDALSNMDVPSFYPQAALTARVGQLPTEFPLLPARDFNTMKRFVDTRLGDPAKNTGTLTGEQLKQLDSELGQHVRNLRTSTTAADKTAAPAWAELQQTIREMMAFAQADPAKQQALSNANAAYRQLLAVEKALLPGADQFTPRQLRRALDKSNIKDTELRTVGDAMSATLPNQVPSSGTAERLFAASLPAMLMGGGAAAQGMGWNELGAGAMAAGALGSRAGARFMTGQMRNQQLLADTLRRLAPRDAHAASRKDQQ